jgi:hypothetical protein
VLVEVSVGVGVGHGSSEKVKQSLQSAKGGFEPSLISTKSVIGSQLYIGYQI